MLIITVAVSLRLDVVARVVFGSPTKLSRSQDWQTKNFDIICVEQFKYG